MADTKKPKHKIMDPDAFASYVGMEILLHREAHSLSQEELGGLVELDQSVISRVERGARSVSLYDFYLICRALGVNVLEILPPYMKRGE